MEFPVLFVFCTDMLGNAPYASLADDAYVKTMIFQNLSWRFTGFVCGHEELLELFSKSDPCLSNLTDDSPKLDRIKEMLEEEIIPNGHKAIIFSQWSTIAKDLGIELSEYDPIVITGEVPPEQRQRLVDNFQTNPHCKVAIGTIGAMGTGLTLNKASYVFFMDKAWNSGDNAQAEDRAHRIGTVGAVNVISMVAKGTIDEAVEDYLLENKDLIDRVVDGKGSKQDIKTILNKLLSI